MEPYQEFLHYMREALREKHGEVYDAITEEEQAGLLIQVINDHTEQMRREHRLRPRP